MILLLQHFKPLGHKIQVPGTKPVMMEENHIRMGSRDIRDNMLERQGVQELAKLRDSGSKAAGQILLINGLEN